MDYKNTLNLPNTSFPMKASLTMREPERLKKWEEAGAYELMLKARENNDLYVLHDGPPYANGHIHIGHALNKVLKDFVVKVKALEGFKTPYIPGWDCHGLPIEHQVDKKLGSKKKDMTTNEIRKQCRAYAENFINIQRDEFKRLGIFGEWDERYATMDFQYEADILRELYRVYNTGGVYKGLKPVYWCTSCVTALAEAEVEYHDHTSHSIYVKFPLSPADTEKLGLAPAAKASMVIWTTTPWTLPANLGIALNPELEYTIAKVTDAGNRNIETGEYVIFATELIEDLAETLEFSFDTFATMKGDSFEKMTAKHPFYDRDSLVVLGDHVTLEAGTGLVHTAPGHGQEDYEVGRQYGLEVYNPVDDYGFYRPGTGIFDGKKITDANADIIALMDENGSLLSTSKMGHSYPHCWRCKNPVIFRATPQWFISMETNDLRANTLKAIGEVKWVPKWGENRIRSMMETRPDWCISRQRTWGVPIAVFSCVDCGETFLPKDVQETVLAAFEKEGADAWFEHEAEHFLPSGAKCEHCGSSNLKKETDILDVWFESGTSHAAVLERRDLPSPADMYLEGSDQHRGWFHSSILESVATRGRAPYKEVLTHGFTVDGEGKKMSKSIGNTVNPEDIIKQQGAEIIRLWVAAEDYTEDIRISKDIISRLTDSYRKVRNTARYMLGNIDDFNPDTDMVADADMVDLDRYVLHRWSLAKKRILDAYRKHQFHGFYHTFLNFCIVDLSSFYLDIIKDRAYCSAKDSRFRRSAQTAMFILTKEMSIVMSPVLSFTADEVWEHLPAWSGKPQFVFEATYPEVAHPVDASFVEKWDRIVDIRGAVNRAMEPLKADKTLKKTLDAEVTLHVKDMPDGLLDVEEGARRIFLVSKLTVADAPVDGYVNDEGDISIAIEKSDHEACARCWVREPLGKDPNHPELCPRCAEAIS